MDRIWFQDQNSMAPACLMSTDYANAGSVMVRNVFLAHIGPLDTKHVL